VKEESGGGRLRGVWTLPSIEHRHNYIVSFVEGLVKALEHFFKRKIRMVEERGAIPRRLGK
jgi:hypothetical protein